MRIVLMDKINSKVFLILIGFFIIRCGVQVPDEAAYGNCDQNGDCTFLEFDEDVDGNIVVGPADDEFVDDTSDSETAPIGEGNVGSPIEGHEDPLGGEDNIDTSNPPSGGGLDLSPIGQAIADGIKSIGQAFKGAASFVSGESQKKMKEAKKQKERIENKIKEAQSLAEQLQEYQEQIAEQATILDQKGKDLSKQNNHDHGSTEEMINRAGHSHNKTIDDIRGQYPNIDSGVDPQDPQNQDDDNDNDDCLLKLKTCSDITPEDEKIIETREYINYARKRTRDYTGAQKKQADVLLDTAEVTTDFAEGSYARGSVQEGDAYTETALALADFAVGFVPGLGWAHDVYQAFMGKNAITGESVEGFDRTMAVMGALSGGIFSKFGNTLKGVDFLHDLSKSDNLIKDTDKFTDALDAARGYNKHGLDKDSIDGILKGAGDCLVYSIDVEPKSIFERMLGVVESTAFAANKRPCKEVIDDVVGSANKNAKDWEKSISHLPPGEKVAKVRPVAEIKAKINGWNKNTNLKKKNNRDIYTDKKGTHWGVDTQHGRWEKFNKKTGKHEGEFDFDGNFIENSIVSSRYIIL